MYEAIVRQPTDEYTKWQWNFQVLVVVVFVCKQPQQKGRKKDTATAHTNTATPQSDRVTSVNSEYPTPTIVPYCAVGFFAQLTTT